MRHRLQEWRMNDIGPRQAKLAHVSILPGTSEPLAVRIPEACRISGIGRSKLYELIAAGEIEIIKVGTITLIPMAALVRFVQRRRIG